MASADLSTTKTASRTTAFVGDTITYTITATNGGPDAATEVVISDTIPAQTSLNAITTVPSNKGYITYTNNTIYWHVGNMAKNENLTLSVTVTACQPGLAHNQSSITGKETDPNINNNGDYADVLIQSTPVPTISEADLGIWKESCPRIVNAGTNFIYYIQAINNGPDKAFGVTVTDTVPTGLSPVLAIPAGTITGNTVVWDLGDMNPNERQTLSLIVKPIVTETTSFENFATISSDSPTDPNPANNIDSALTTVVPATDLSIEKTASPNPVIVGEAVTYTIVVTNNGPSAAEFVTVTDTLPDSLTDVVITSTAEITCTHVGNVYTCQLVQPIESGDSVIITITARTTAPGCITNTAAVDTSTTDINPCNNTASACVLVRRPIIDLKVSKTHSPEQVALCTPLTYTLTVTNDGPAPATGVVLTDRLPASVKLLAVCSSQGQYKTCGNEVICQLGSLPANNSATVEITVKPCQLGSIINTAIVTSNEEDDDLTNNQAIDRIIIITPSEQVTYLIDLVNHLVMTDALPELYSKCLITHLQNAKQAFTCGTTTAANYSLSYFIEAVNNYIAQDILSAANGCMLIKIAEGLKNADCKGHRLEQGDEHCEHS